MAAVAPPSGAHTRGQQPPRTVEVTGGEQARHPIAGAAQRRPAQRHERRDRRPRRFTDRTPPPGPAPHGAGAQRHHTEQRRGVAHPGAAGVGVDAAFQSCCGTAEHRHRMAARRIAEHGVGHHAGRDPRSPGRRHPGTVSQPPKARCGEVCGATLCAWAT
jgi:hypothetical protein